jgi:hypothetical protein
MIRRIRCKIALHLWLLADRIDPLVTPDGHLAVNAPWRMKLANVLTRLGNLAWPAR